MSRDPLVRHAGRLRNLEHHLQFSPVMVTYEGDPSGALTAREGTFCWDVTNHDLYANTSNVEGTTWTKLT
jgi:hypothetical protein